jgi:heme-degrading monooxygenase HmoA
MIARLWSARASQAQTPLYLRHFSSAVLPALQRFDGYISSTVLTRPSNDEIEILVLTVWQSFSAIDAFAVRDRDAAVVAPEAASLLRDYDRHVRHFEIAASDGFSFG